MSSQLSRYIRVRGEYEGFHWYENAPDEVAFLKLRHRHVFKWEVMIGVTHDDRELEFFMVKDLVKHKILAYTTMKDNLGSCEQQAEAILNGVKEAYGCDRWYLVVVSEDGENDGLVEWQPEDHILVDW